MAAQFTICSPSKTFGLLQVPYEIRAIIYAYALTEPILWDRAHSPYCHYQPRDTSTLDIPPFFLVGDECDQYDDYGHHKDHDENPNRDLNMPSGNLPRPSLCPCARRKGLGLLLLSRQVYKEASPLFWERSTFCFLDVNTFSASVLHFLRPSIVERIRSVSIMYAQHFASGMISDIEDDDYEPAVWGLWNAVARCKNLLKLELPPSCLLDLSDNFVAGSLPQRLDTVSLTYVEQIADQRGRSIFSWEGNVFDCEGQRISKASATFVRCFRQASLRKLLSEELVHECVRELTTNFIIHVRNVTMRELLGMDPHSTEPQQFKITPGLNRESNKRAIKLPTGEETRVTIYGLPLSKRVHLLRVKQAQQNVKLVKQKQNTTRVILGQKGPRGTRKGG